MAYIKSFDETEIYYEKKTSRKPKGTILFVHGGFFGNHTLLKKLYSHFKKDYNLILPDVRAKGDSGFPKNIDTISLDDYAKDLYQILKKEKIKKIYLVGVSFGGLISLKFFELFSRKIKIIKLVLISSTYTMEKVESSPFIKPFKYLFPLVKKLNGKLNSRERRKEKIDFSNYTKRKFYISHFLRILSSNSIKTILLRSVAASYVSSYCVEKETLKKIDVPVLIIYGKKDEYFSEHIQLELIDNIKNSKKEAIGKGHNVYMFEHEEVAKKIKGFLI